MKNVSRFALLVSGTVVALVCGIRSFSVKHQSSDGAFLLRSPFTLSAPIETVSAGVEDIGLKVAHQAGIKNLCSCREMSLLDGHQQR